MGKKFNCDIVAKSTFSNEGGTKICKQIESSEIKSIVKNEKLVTIRMEKEEPISEEEFYEIYQNLLQNNLIVESFEKGEYYLQFRIKKAEQNKVQELLDCQYPEYQIRQEDSVKLSIVGYGIIQDNEVLKKVMATLKKYKIEIMGVNLTQAKIEILIKEIENDVIEELHQKLIKKS